MKFWEAMKALEEGKKVTDNEGKTYYFIQDGEPGMFWLCAEESTDEIHTTSIIDYMGRNWEIYEEKKEVDPRFKEFYHYLKDEHGFVNNQYTDYINDHNEPDYLLKFYQQLLEMAKYYKLD